MVVRSEVEVHSAVVTDKFPYRAKLAREVQYKTRNDLGSLLYIYISGRTIR